MNEYCPDCVKPLIKQSKKLGKLSVWLVCPNCGFRKRPESPYSIQKSLEAFESLKKETNENDFNNENKELRS